MFGTFSALVLAVRAESTAGPGVPVLLMSVAYGPRQQFSDPTGDLGPDGRAILREEWTGAGVNLIPEGQAAAGLWLTGVIEEMRCFEVTGGPTVQADCTVIIAWSLTDPTDPEHPLWQAHPLGRDRESGRELEEVEQAALRAALREHARLILRDPAFMHLVRPGDVVDAPAAVVQRPPAGEIASPPSDDLEHDFRVDRRDRIALALVASGVGLGALAAFGLVNENAEDDALAVGIGVGSLGLIGGGIYAGVRPLTGGAAVAFTGVF